MSVAAPPATSPVVGMAPVDPRPRRRSAQRAIVSVVALFCIYGALTLLNDPRGTLGTDTGGKIATLHMMSDGNALDPDLGYWAERFDTDGSLHPLFYTEHIGHRWVNATTLPMLYAALPLYELGGERATLLLPMIGGMLAALACRALARRMWGGNRWSVFWAIGLATPITIYALDFWEHTLGVALAMWAVVLLFDIYDGRGGVRTALAAGSLFGLAATMRTEMLVYAVVLAGLVSVARARARRQPVRALIATGGPVAIGLGVVLLANQVLERATLGEGFRAARATGTAARAASDLGVRTREAITTTVGVNGFGRPLDWLLGTAIVLALALVVRALVGRDVSSRRVATVGLAVVCVLYAARFAQGLGFVPGLLSASPLVAAGVALAWSDPRGRRLAVGALAPLPLVWLFQYSGGAEPQWGSRYVLTTGALLAVAGIVVLSRAGRVVIAALVLLGLAVTGCGVAWLSLRSHAVADAMEHLVRRDDEAVLSLEAHLLREGGAFYDEDQQWLTATDSSEVREAIGVLRRASIGEVAVISRSAEGPGPQSLGPFVRQGSEKLEFLPGLWFTIATYERG